MVIKTVRNFVIWLDSFSKTWWVCSLKKKLNSWNTYWLSQTADMLNVGLLGVSPAASGSLSWATETLNSIIWFSDIVAQVPYSSNSRSTIIILSAFILRKGKITSVDFSKRCEYKSRIGDCGVRAWLSDTTSPVGEERGIGAGLVN